MLCGIKDILRYDAKSGQFFYKKDGNNQFTKSGALAGSFDHKGYRKIKFRGKTYAAHRMAWWWRYGVLPKDQIDHINGVKDDNRIENLRQATNSQNQRNTKSRNTKGRTSKYKGVSWHKQARKWRADINIGPRGGKKHYFLGLFEAEEDARNAYLTAAIKLHGEFFNANMG